MSFQIAIPLFIFEKEFLSCRHIFQYFLSIVNIIAIRERSIITVIKLRKWRMCSWDAKKQYGVSESWNVKTINKSARQKSNFTLIHLYTICRINKPRVQIKRLCRKHCDVNLSIICVMSSNCHGTLSNFVHFSLKSFSMRKYCRLPSTIRKHQSRGDKSVSSQGNLSGSFVHKLIRVLKYFLKLNS